jgi:hypothetical protein
MTKGPKGLTRGVVGMFEDGSFGNSTVGGDDERGHASPVGPGTAAAARAGRMLGPAPRPGRRRLVVGTQPQGGRRDLLEQMRRMALYLETAEVLELRASRSANATLAALLRERADERRRLAERLRGQLLREGVVVDRSPGRSSQHARFHCARRDGRSGQR